MAPQYYHIIVTLSSYRLSQTESFLAMGTINVIFLKKKHTIFCVEESRVDSWKIGCKNVKYIEGEPARKCEDLYVCTAHKKEWSPTKQSLLNREKKVFFIEKWKIDFLSQQYLHFVSPHHSPSHRDRPVNKIQTFSQRLISNKLRK